MDDQQILTIHAAGRQARTATVAPSPVFDLLIASFYLRGVIRGSREPLPWAAELRDREPELVQAAADLAGSSRTPTALFGMALEFGYASDADPERFLADLPRLPALMKDALPRGEEESGVTPKDLPDEELARHAQEVLGKLWRELGPMWQAEGRAAAESAAQEVRARLSESGDVLSALPRRHFGQFEHIGGRLRDAYARGRLLIIPLVFAEGGGFHVDGAEFEAVGFGLHVDRVYETLEQQVSTVSASAKVFADPTRLMLLAMISKFDNVMMTVTDLAKQLGVSQPTVSGHLKQLRDAGLVRMERKGNATYPKANDAQVRKLLEGMADLFRE